MRIADCGMRIEKNPKNPKSEIAGPVLFPYNALASGPQACFFAERAIEKVTVGMNLACPLGSCPLGLPVRWGSGWRNSDHQARRDYGFLITFPPIILKERPAGNHPKRKECAEPSHISNFLLKGPLRWKNHCLRMMTRIPPP